MVRHTRKSKRTLDVRSEKEVDKLNSLMNQAPFTLVLIYADWCPHCHEYLPTWDEFANLPGRNANMAKVHFDMQEKIPTIANAKINGYPSVIKVLPNGTIEEFKDESGESTNMQNKNEMMKNLMIKPVSANKLFGKKSSNKLRRNWNMLNTVEATKAVEEKNAEELVEAVEIAKEKNAAEAEEIAEVAEIAKEKNAAEVAEIAKEKNAAEVAEIAKEKNAAKVAEIAKEKNAAEVAEIAKEKKAARNAIKEGVKNKIKNINIYPGVLTSKDVFETENELIKQRGGRRKKIQSFLTGGSMLEDLRELGKYLKK
jgi:thiol-disulfide isomerase/thioredoxin